MELETTVNVICDADFCASCPQAQTLREIITIAECEQFYEATYA